MSGSTEQHVPSVKQKLARFVRLDIITAAIAQMILRSVRLGNSLGHWDGRPVRPVIVLCSFEVVAII
jgi:hypothetical protein